MHVQFGMDTNCIESESGHSAENQFDDLYSTSLSAMHSSYLLEEYLHNTPVGKGLLILLHRETK